MIGVLECSARAGNIHAARARCSNTTFREDVPTERSQPTHLHLTFQHLKTESRSVRSLDGTGHAHTLGRPRRFLARRGNGRIEYAAHRCMNAMVSADTVAMVSAVVSTGFPRAPQRESEAEAEQPQTHQYRWHHP